MVVGNACEVFPLDAVVAEGDDIKACRDSSLSMWSVSNARSLRSKL